MEQTVIEFDKDRCLDALVKFVNKPTGMDARNYFSDWRDKDGIKAFRSEYREILRDGKDARLLIWVTRGLVPSDLLASRAGDRLGRLIYNSVLGEWDYCVGQYWCTEYRRSVCWMLAQLIRSALTPQDDRDWKERDQAAIKRATQILGRGIVKRWF